MQDATFLLAQESPPTSESCDYLRDQVVKEIHIHFEQQMLLYQNVRICYQVLQDRREPLVIKIT